MNRKWEVLRAMQNDFEVRELDGHARKNVIAIIKKIASKLFVVILLASVLIGMLAVIPEEVRAQTMESLPSSDTLIESTKDSIAKEIIKTPRITPEYFKELTPAYPSSPQDLKSSPGDGYVVLSWAAPSLDGGSAITEYRIYRGTSEGKEVLLDSVTAPRTWYKDTAVKNGQTYYYKVTAVNKEEEEGTSASTKATPTSIVTKPSSPQKLQSEASDRSVYLEWIAPDDDGGSKITKYNIYRGSTSGGETLLTTVGNVLTYTDNDVTNDRTYYYQVSAVNSVGEGEKSDEASATPSSGITTPSRPRALKATASDRVVNLNWHAPIDDGGSAITEYTIYRGTSSDAESYLDSVSATTYRDKAVTNGQTYYYHVTAGNVAGESSPSDEVSAIPQGPPGPSRNLQAAAGDGYVDLSWNPPSNDGGSPITGYKIYRGTALGGEIFVKAVGNMLIYTDSDVSNNQTYYYQVSAENSAGEGNMSIEVDAIPKSSLTQTTAPLVTTPSAPLNFKASAGDGNVNLEWREPSDKGGSLITNYNIYRGTTPGGETLRGRVSNVLNYTDDIVINNQTYYYQVSAENSAGEGNMSDEASATLIPGVTVPSAPQDLNADRGDEYVDLSWNPPSNDGGSPITKYKVYRGMAPRGEEFVAEIDNAVNYRDYYVTNDQQYYYQVSAVNLPGEGEKSNEVEVDVEPKGDTLGMGVWITIIVALIGALGVIAAALINYLSSKKTK